MELTNVAIGIIAIIFWEILDFISPRIKVGLCAALMSSHDSQFQGFGVVIIFRLFWNGVRNFIRTQFQKTYNQPTDTDGIRGA